MLFGVYETEEEANDRMERADTPESIPSPTEIYVDEYALRRDYQTHPGNA